MKVLARKKLRMDVMEHLNYLLRALILSLGTK